MHLPEVVASSSQDDPVCREALPLHDEGDIAVLLSEHQGAQLLRQQVDVVDLRHGGQWTQRVAVTHGGQLPDSHLEQEETCQTESKPGLWKKPRGTAFNFTICSSSKSILLVTSPALLAL